jgi:ubiquinone/menaquinone biosynthesis C-methylase UbiE
MNHFDNVADTWDNNPIHWDRSRAIVNELLSVLPESKNFKALEYGAGTAILSFLLSDYFSEITLMDSSAEMVRIMNEKVVKTGLSHMKPLFFDLEHNNFSDTSFDLIYSQMVFHHVDNIEALLSRFYNILNPGGYLAIADLYTEDGSFHDYTFKGHKGFDPDELSKTLGKYKFRDMSHKQCYIVKRESPNETLKEFPVFLLTAIK